ncbi:phage tail protein [Chelonobacter oris]|uniref:phage virion morphogenesis protein n=1 Tax=Chelonobacter oris TaxID=505317 RepID=UPI0024476EEB|nr:phage virion morphogenesis protein [Chelonobacter oris]MDH3000946.1 phage tail protein [Chelonobacter oris]
MTELAPLQTKLNSLIANLKPQSRRELARQISLKLAESQRRRIRAQQNPDGSAFEPRKPRKKVRQKTGRIKTQLMFKKLGSARLMKRKITAEGVTIGYQGANAHIASIHQFGLKSAVDKARKHKMQYAQRELLGFTERDLEWVENLVLEQLGKG